MHFTRIPQIFGDVPVRSIARECFDSIGQKLVCFSIPGLSTNRIAEFPEVEPQKFMCHAHVPRTIHPGGEFLKRHQLVNGHLERKTKKIVNNDGSRTCDGASGCGGSPVAVLYLRTV